MKYVFLFMLINSSISISAQNITIFGSIENGDREKIANASVILKDKGTNTILTYSYSNDKGQYKITYSGAKSSLLITVSGMNFISQSKEIENKTQEVNFNVKIELKQLKEVVIKTQKITYRKDTINYLVSSFSTDKDYAIGDVLKRMPGIDVAQSGQISYQGKPIDKFYIENLDMLNGRYGIATQNISAKDVASVQIMENHQPIKAIDSTRISDQAAINLKLKDSAKGTLSIMTKLGSGISPFLWESELTGMYFAKGKQNITSYKSNNAGYDLSKELRSFNSSLNLSMEHYTNIQMPNPPDIEKKRYLFNNSNAITFNNLLSLDKDRQLNLNIIYYNDHEKRKSNETSSYFITNDSLLVIDENIKSSNNTDRLETEFRYNENSEKRYLNNFLNIEGTWENNKGIITNTRNIDQRLNRPSLRVQNDFHFIKKNTGKSGFEIRSQAGFRRSPQNLTIRPGLYENIINKGKEYNSLRQDVMANTFISKNNIMLLSPFIVGKVVINPNAGFDVEINHLNSELYGYDHAATQLSGTKDSLRNNITRYHYKPHLGFDMSYKVGNIRFNINLPAGINFYKLKNNVFSHKNENISRFYFDPSVLIQYKMSQKIEITSSSSLYNGFNSIYELYSGAILRSYRYLNAYDSKLSKYRGCLVSGKVTYKDIINMLFISGDISYNYQKNDVIYTQSFDGILSSSSLLNKPNHRNRISTTGKISKGFDLMKISSAIEVNYNTSSSQQIRQSKLVKSTNDYLTISGKMSAVPTSFIIVSYDGVWEKSRSKIESEQSFTPIKSFTNTINVDFTISKKVRIGSQVEHYYNSSAQKQKNIYFADINANYTWKHLHFGIEWNNIFNTKHYTQAYYNEINQYYYYYNIRHSNIMLKIRMKLK